MTYGIEAAEMIEVDRVFLDYENPRHIPYSSQAEVIEYLCSQDQILPLAKDIVKHGLNPLDLFALVRAKPNRKGRKTSYISVEGNRRMCALKLLNDPDLAPTKQRKDFERQSSKWQPIPKIFAVVFNDKADVKLWIDRFHQGEQGGIGRKRWNADQKQRSSGSYRYALAQTVLDYAQDKGLISNDDRQRKLTTAQRYLGNRIFRENMGIDNANPEDISRNRIKEDFDLILEKFISDLLSGTVNSRSKAAEIETYSRELASLNGLKGSRVEPDSLDLGIKNNSHGRKLNNRPTKSKALRHITYDKGLHEALIAIPSYKLEKLYYSICDIDLSRHTPLLAIGMWSFVESLTALTGRLRDTAFPAYLTANSLADMGLGDNKTTKAIREAVTRISEYGNTTKHHKSSAVFNGDQLANDVETIGMMLHKLAEKAKNKP